MFIFICSIVYSCRTYILVGMWFVYTSIYACHFSCIFDVIHAECGNILVLLNDLVEL